MKKQSADWLKANYAKIIDQEQITIQSKVDCTKIINQEWIAKQLKIDYAKIIN